MICSACGSSAKPQQRFCGDCGSPLSGAAGHVVSTGGGDVHGGVYQAGRDMVVNPAPNVPPPATYDAVPMWRSPVTQGFLSWAGLLLGLAGFFPLWKAVQLVRDLLSGGVAARAQKSGQYWWNWYLTLGLLAFCLVMFSLVMALRRLTKHQLRVPLVWGLALSGAERRITLEKIRANCPECGGKMRYYNKATEWREIEENGSKRREVTERVPVLECKRNPKHCFQVDPAEYREA